LPDIILGGIAPVRQTPDGPSGPLRRHAVEDRAGQLTTGLIRHVEGLGLRSFARECAAYGDAEGVPWPPGERHGQDAQDAGQAAPCPVCLPGGAGAITVAGEPFAMVASCFLGRIVAADPHDPALGANLGRQAATRAPEGPAVLGERAPEEDRAS